MVCLNCYIHGVDQNLSFAGQENIIIVVAKDEVMVCQPENTQDVKALAQLGARHPVDKFRQSATAKRV